MVRQTCRNCMFLKLSVVLFFFGCAQLNSESTEVERILEGKISDESSGKPLVVDVFLYKLRKPLFSMRGWERIAMTKTDEHGFFSFYLKTSSRRSTLSNFAAHFSIRVASMFLTSSKFSVSWFKFNAFMRG